MKNITGVKSVSQKNLASKASVSRLAKALLKGQDLIVVSNREPYTHIGSTSTGRPRIVRSAGGLVSALDPVLHASKGTWIAYGGGSEDFNFVNSANKLLVPILRPQYTLKRVKLNAKQHQGHYTGFANEGLWPLCHNVDVKPVFRPSNWFYYKQVNQKFANSVIDEAKTASPIIFIQDYHLALLPKYIRTALPESKIELFWHIPWPRTERFYKCSYGRQLVAGLLASDIISFHIDEYAQKFMQTAAKLTCCKVNSRLGIVQYRGHKTLVRSYPIGIDWQSLNSGRLSVAARTKNLRRRLHLRGVKIALSIERVDYTKGILERLKAIDWFFSHYPQYQKKIVFIQVGSPSRSHIAAYRELAEDIVVQVSKINSKYGTATWQPIIHMQREISQHTLKPLLSLAGICIVSSLQDGMNLVAKEYVAMRNKNDGILVLSKFAGASNELKSALLIDPRNTAGFAKSIRVAVDMPPSEQRRRMKDMRKAVAQNNVYTWIGAILTELVDEAKE